MYVSRSQKQIASRTTIAAGTSAGMLGVAAGQGLDTQGGLFVVDAPFNLNASTNQARVQTPSGNFVIDEDNFLVRDGQLLVDDALARSLVLNGVGTTRFSGTVHNNLALVPGGNTSTFEPASDGNTATASADVAALQWAAGGVGVLALGGLAYLLVSNLGQLEDKDASENNAPVLPEIADIRIFENTTGVIGTYAASDEDTSTLTYKLIGPDAASFEINNTGQISVLSTATLDFENPSDGNVDNVYTLTLGVVDQDNASGSRTFNIIVEDADDVAPVFTDGASLAVTANENAQTTSVLSLGVTDGEASTLRYSISGGADFNLFDIDHETGQITFLAAPNYEAPDDTGGDNVYDLQVTVTDGGGNTDTITLAVTVANVNEAVVLAQTDTHATTVTETNHAWVYNNPATDPDSTDTPTYSLGGTNAGLFAVSPAGQVGWAGGVAPDFEAVGAGPLLVTLTATDATDGSTSTQDIQVTLVNVDDEAPTFASSTTSVTTTENTTSITLGTAFGLTDADTTPLNVTYSIATIGDHALFAIDATTGALSFQNAPDFENPTDSGANNTYDVTVNAIDPGGNQGSIAIMVEVTDVAEAVVLADTTPHIETVSETDHSWSYSNVATDPDNSGAPTYALSGTNAALFAVSAVGTVSWAGGVAPDFDSPGGVGAGPLQATLTATDAADGSTSTQSIEITLGDVDDEAPSFPAASTSISVVENTTVATPASNYTPSDRDALSTTFTYTITGGADAGLFVVNATSGALEFRTTPDFEGAGDNQYQVEVTATDGGGNSGSVTVDVTVTNQNEAVVLSDTSTYSESVRETDNTWSYTNVATDPDNAGTPTYTIDNSIFAVSATGVVSWASGAAPSFEATAVNPITATLTATDPTDGSTSTQNIQITILDENDEAPVFANGNTAATVSENTTAITLGADYNVTDNDAGPNNFTYTISGGVDAQFFVVDAASGALSFRNAPDFETMADSGANGIYNLVVTATDDAGNQGSINIAVTVTNQNEDVALATTATRIETVSEANDGWTYSNVAIDPDNAGTPTYAVTGTNGALFAVSTAGVVTWAGGAAPDFDTLGSAPLSATLVATDATDGSTSTQNLTITLADADDEAPTFAMATGAITTNVNENTTTVPLGAGYVVSDADTPLSAITYTLVGTTDDALFAVDSASGALDFRVAPDFENPNDAGANGVYNVTVAATDSGGNQDTVAIEITLDNVNEDVALATTTTRVETVSETDNTWSYTNVATDPDNSGAPVYALTGTNAALFSVSSAGVVSWVGGAAPDFETVGAGAFQATLVATDATDGSASTQDFAITLADVDDEAPTFASAMTTTNVNENTTAITLGADYVVSDTDAASTAFTYIISGGADATKFAIDDAATGALAFRSAPDFETPGDANADNSYQVEVTVEDPGNNMATIQITVVVDDVAGF